MLVNLIANLRAGGIIFARSTQRRLAYPMGMFLDLISFVAVFGLTFLLWSAVRNEGATLAMAWEDFVRYLIMAFGISFTFEFGSYQFQQSIRSGMIAVDLLRPVPLSWLYFCNSMSWAVIQGIYTLVALVLASHWLPDMKLPSDAGHWMALMLSLGLAAFLQFSIILLFANGAFVTQFGYGIFYVRLLFHQVFSGAFAPIALFPDALKPWAYALPFRHVVDTPVRIALGMTSAGEIPWLLLQQALWGLGLFLAAQLAFRFLLGRAQIQGG